MQTMNSKHCTEEKILPQSGHNPEHSPEHDKISDKLSETDTFYIYLLATTVHAATLPVNIKCQAG